MKNKTTYNRSMHDKKHTYTPISSKLINNNDLTGEERFLLIFLLGRSDDYILNSSYFANNARKYFGWGRDKFYNIWKSLQSNGYIVKRKFRDSGGKIDGHHYTVHETSDLFLKNQNTENPESGKTGIWQTSALPSIDKPNIDKPIKEEPNEGSAQTTSTNLNGESTKNSIAAEPDSILLKSNNKIKEIYDVICSMNPDKYSNTWKMNDRDRYLIQTAIDLLGFDKAMYLAVDRIQNSKKPYSSVSYIFSDLEDETNLEIFLKKNPEKVDEYTHIMFSDDNVEKALNECEDSDMFYDFIKNGASLYHEKAKYWSPSDDDLLYCESLRLCDPNINLAEKLRGGLKSAIQKDEWRFGQIVYQAMTAIEARELLCN